ISPYLNELANPLNTKAAIGKRPVAAIRAEVYGTSSAVTSGKFNCHITPFIGVNAHLSISVTKNGAKRSTASLDCPLMLARNLPFHTVMLYCATSRYE